VLRCNLILPLEEEVRPVTNSGLGNSSTAKGAQAGQKNTPQRHSARTKKHSGGEGLDSSSPVSDQSSPAGKVGGHQQDRDNRNNDDNNDRVGSTSGGGGIPKLVLKRLPGRTDDVRERRPSVSSTGSESDIEIVEYRVIRRSEELDTGAVGNPVAGPEISRESHIQRSTEDSGQARWKLMRERSRRSSPKIWIIQHWKCP
jgi:hypothetical protein